MLIPSKYRSKKRNRVFLPTSGGVCIRDRAFGVFRIERPFLKMKRPECANLFSELGDDLFEPTAFGSRYPLQPKAFWIYAHPLKHHFRERDASQALVITLDIVAVARMAAADEHSVGAVFQRGEDEAGVNATAAHHADAGDVGRIFHSGRSGEVGAGVAAPVAEQPEDAWFK